MVKKIPFAEFKAIYDKVPRLCVELMIQNEKGILLTKRDIEPAKGYWHLPGGTVLKGESVKETAQRVAIEELGIAIKLKSLIGYIEYTPEMALGQAVSLVFHTILTSENIILNEQASEAAYFSLLPEETITETRKFLEENVLK